MKNKSIYIAVAVVLLLFIIGGTWAITGNAFKSLPQSASAQSVISNLNNKNFEYTCSIFGGASINSNKTGYENCKEKGYLSLCLLQRTSKLFSYQGLNCQENLI